MNLEHQNLECCVITYIDELERIHKTGHPGKINDGTRKRMKRVGVSKYNHSKRIYEIPKSIMPLFLGVRALLIE